MTGHSTVLHPEVVWGSSTVTVEGLVYGFREPKGIAPLTTGHCGERRTPSGRAKNVIQADTGLPALCYEVFPEVFPEVFHAYRVDPLTGLIRSTSSIGF